MTPFAAPSIDALPMPGEAPRGHDVPLGQAAVHDGHAAGKRRAVQLHVVHNWSGGIHRWLHDYCRADRQRVNLVLKPIGTPAAFAEGLALYAHVDDIEPIGCWQLDPPIRATALEHAGYGEALAEIVSRHGVGAVLVSSLVGQSLDVLRTGLPTAIVAHDFFPTCAALNPFFQSPCDACDATRLARCFAANPRNVVARIADAEHWSDVRRQLLDLVLAQGIEMIVPSRSVQDGLLRLEPRFAAARFHVVPHGLETRLWRAQPRGSAPRQRPRAVVLGRLTPEKGAALLADAIEGLSAVCDLSLVGCGAAGWPFDARPGITLVPRYRLHELPALLRELDPDFGLLLSTSPETFSYTLSELMALGIPPVATRLGSFAERIVDGQNGFLCEPQADDLLRVVRGLCDAPHRLEAVRQRLHAWQHPSLDMMIARYHALLPAAHTAAPPAAPPDSVRADRGEASGKQVFEQLLDRVLAEETFEGLLDRLYQVFCLKVAATPRLRAWQRPIARCVVGSGYRMLKFATWLMTRAAKARHGG